MDQLEQKIGYRFRNKKLLRQALTHSSYANEKKLGKLGCNERLEFLGDAVLELISSDVDVYKRQGVRGVAIATVSCQGVSAVLVTGMLMKDHGFFRLEIKKIRFYGVSLKSILRIGIPAGIEAAMYLSLIHS